MTFRDAFMTAAKRAQAFAEGQVNVKTYAFSGIAFRERLYKSFFPCFSRKTVVFPIGYRWITGVSRSWDIVFLY